MSRKNYLAHINLVESSRKKHIGMILTIFLLIFMCVLLSWSHNSQWGKYIDYSDVQGVKMIKITEQLYISENELKFTASRSGGPGGQHVNKVSTRITLSFDVINSHALSDDQKQLILRRLATRINRQGILQIAGQEHRSQTSNRNAAIERFVELCEKL
jgi:protein subunit release factor B